MPGESQPLVSNQKIANADGTPTEYFIRWAQDRQIDIQGGISAEQAQQLIVDWAAAREILAGVGLDGGGPLSANVTIDLADTAVTPGVYGDASNTCVITVDQQGRITDISTVPIAGGGGGTPPTFVGAIVVWVNNSNTVNVPLPGGAVAGDVCVFAANNGWQVNTPTGFTSLDNQVGSNTNGACGFKALSAGDISAGFITITFVNVYYGAAGVSVFAGATVASLTLGGAIRNSGNVTPQAVSTALPLLPSQTAVVYGGTRGNGSVSFAIASLDSVTVNLEGSAAIGRYTPPVSGIYTETITYGNTPSGNYNVIVVVTGV